MNAEIPQEVSIAETRIADALNALTRDLKPLENVIDAFRPVFLASARIKALAPGPRIQQHPQLDILRFERGVSYLTPAEFIHFDDEAWGLAFQTMTQALNDGFPKLADELKLMQGVMTPGGIDGQRLLKALLEDRLDEATVIASGGGIDIQTAGFVLRQIARPLVEMAARQLSNRIQGLHWPKGFCPLCGSMPELSCLKGEEGQRWLRCSFCSHEWRLGRLMCPFCETAEHDHFLIFHIAGRESERVEACSHCRRYVLSIDLRDRAEKPVLEVATIGLVHLDVLAQQKGFLPAAQIPWNHISDGNTASLPFQASHPETLM